MFPVTRLRRLRMNPILRNLVQETKLTIDDFIYPLFVVPGEGVKTEVRSMAGVYQQSIDMILRDCEESLKLGLKSFILFGIPDSKDEKGLSANNENGIIQNTLRELKKAFAEDILLVTDLCFCEYTDHGHCGPISHGTVDNDETIRLLGIQAASHAEAGADIIAPSGMMDGMIASIRQSLDEGGFESLPIMSYAVKYASAYYGPFRDAAESTPQFGDRRSYQMDPANRLEAFREAQEDIAEGADMLMVKPALSYLDVIREVKDRFNLPLAAYNVSGEYSMVKAASQLGYIDEQKLVLETMTSMKRAGADIILSYHAKDVARWLMERGN
ncbi:MAG: porphobilinogen synthase [Spirochaetota bacterium]|nr:porphobilinogen synthase [Spirochaetota bacterium]